MFELPKYKGIEEAMKDCQDHTAKTGCEMSIGLTKYHGRAFELPGDHHKVSLPSQLVNADNTGIFVVHSHPAPFELSTGDIAGAFIGTFDGILAVCLDDTISWTTGPNIERTDLWTLDRMELRRFQHYMGNWQDTILQHIAPNMQDWTDPQKCAASHFTNYAMLHTGGLKDYHVYIGKQCKAMVEKFPHLQEYVDRIIKEAA